MKRNVLSVLLSVVLLLVSIPMSVSAAVRTGKTGDCSWRLEDGHLTISGNGKMGDCTYYSLPWGKDIVSVDIEDGVTYVSANAFYECTKLTSVSFGKDVSSFGGHAFYGCSSLESVVIPEGVTKIPRYAFYECSSLTTVERGQNLTKVEAYAFCRCQSLRSINLPDGVTALGEYAFANCDTFTEVEVPGSVTSLGRSIFAFCDNLVSAKLCEGVPLISLRMFDGCDKLEDVYIPDSVKTIEQAAFVSCDGLESVVLGGGVTEIVRDAFYCCRNLEQITVPLSFTYVQQWGFDKCTGLNDVYYHGTEADKKKISIGSYNSDFKWATWHYAGEWAKGLRYEYKDRQITITGYTDEIEADFTIPTEIAGYPVVAIADGAFRDCETLTSVVIPEQITYIGAETFAGCSNLENVTIPVGVTGIGDGAFVGCDALTEVYYGGSKHQKEQMPIGSNNQPLLDVDWYCASIRPEDHYSPEVDNSVMDTEEGKGLAYLFDLKLTGLKGIQGNRVDFANATVVYKGKTCKVVKMGAVVSNVEKKKMELADVNGKTIVDVPVVYVLDVNSESAKFAIRVINIPDSATERTIYARPYYVVETDKGPVTVYGGTSDAAYADYVIEDETA